MLYLDLETFSELDLRKVSLDRYASHGSTRILMCAYSGDAGPVELWEEADGVLPAALTDAFRVTPDPSIILNAWNVNFERTLLEKRSGVKDRTWFDTMVLARYAGLPGGLKDCNRVPYFASQAETSKESLLINKFCKPQKDGSVRDRNTDPEDWAKFCQYCKDDVHDTRLIYQWLSARFDMPERVQRAWLLDQEVNRRGMPIDLGMTLNAWTEAQRLQEESAQKLKDVTGLENPNSPAQLLKWVAERGYPYGGLGKELVKKALEEDVNSGS